MTNTQTTTKTSHYYLRVLSLMIVVSLLVVSAAKPAHATKVFFVNSTGDEADFDLTDGRCDVEPPSSPLTRCTLRAAIQESNATPRGGPQRPSGEHHSLQHPRKRGANHKAFLTLPPIKTL